MPSASGDTMQPGEFAEPSTLAEMERLRAQLDDKTYECVKLTARLELAEAEIRSKDEKLE